MCTVVFFLRPGAAWPFLIGANRDERLDRPWQWPAAHWPDQPDVIGGLDVPGGGTWKAVNGAGVVAVVLNRVGSLGPAPNKRSRGELPLLALRETSAEAGARRVAEIEAAQWRSFNMVVADRDGAWFLRGLGYGHPEMHPFAPGLHMLAAGEPDDPHTPRIARHLPRFDKARLPEPPDWGDWPSLMSDRSLPAGSEMNIPPRTGFGTSSSSLLGVPGPGAARDRPHWLFTAGPPDKSGFEEVNL